MAEPDESRIDVADRTCTVDGCGRVEQLRRGYCTKHYQRWKKTGDPLEVSVIIGDDEARFWSKVDRRGDDECWPWTDKLDRYGYAVFIYKSENHGAHRWAYAHFVGPIPEGLTIDHVRSRGCTRRDCVNFLAHLEPVTVGENTLRGSGPSAVNATKTQCKRGHEFTPENTYTYTDGRRSCRICMRGHWRDWARSSRAAKREG